MCWFNLEGGRKGKGRREEKTCTKNRHKIKIAKEVIICLIINVLAYKEKKHLPVCAAKAVFGLLGE